MNMQLIIERLRHGAEILSKPLPASLAKLEFDIDVWGKHESAHLPLENHACGTAACGWGQIALVMSIDESLDTKPTALWSSRGESRELEIRFNSEEGLAAAGEWYGLPTNIMCNIFMSDRYAIRSRDVTRELVAGRMIALSHIVEEHDQYADIFEAFSARVDKQNAELYAGRVK